MEKVIYVIFTLGTLCLAGMLFFLGQSRQPGVYPPKQQLKKRGIMLGATGAVLFFVGFVIRSFI
ncbi:hypothetical protein [Bacillus sp. V5-8f]|uniref:hypothetical protein n=1 Tax=Bacillus sp. V5-8f TaxID=2053044 RepID=UPI000C783958|nr:hypothetical protein [Bacillus sp. V5-8f]PLT33795.1 hypothetical protein CUU64_11815 [Bacillus sp. V5-8f]